MFHSGKLKSLQQGLWFSCLVRQFGKYLVHRCFFECNLGQRPILCYTLLYHTSGHIGITIERIGIVKQNPKYFQPAVRPVWPPGHQAEEDEER